MAVLLKTVLVLLLPLLAVHLALSQRPLPGAPQNANLREKDVKEALDVAVSEYNKQHQGLFLSKVFRVVKAQKQVVSGFKYIFKVRMVQTVCRKAEGQGVKRWCSINPNPQLAKPNICNFEVWSQPWLAGPPKVTISCGH